jgi:hypothetical protein
MSSHSIIAQARTAMLAAPSKRPTNPPMEPVPYKLLMGASTPEPLEAALREVSALKAKLLRKQELLRVRSEQLADVYEQAHERDFLWGQVATSASSFAAMRLRRLDACAHCGDYEHYVRHWYRWGTNASIHCACTK